MRTDELDFDLPPDLIAQTPPDDRAASRLLRFSRVRDTITHHHFSDLPTLLRPGDLLVFNDAKVIPARLSLRKTTGGRIDGLFLAEPALGNGGSFSKTLAMHPMERAWNSNPTQPSRPKSWKTTAVENISWQFHRPIRPSRFLTDWAACPLPPYIKRSKHRDDRDPLDRQRYQTVFAAVPAPSPPQPLDCISPPSCCNVWTTSASSEQW